MKKLENDGNGLDLFEVLDGLRIVVIPVLVMIKSNIDGFYRVLEFNKNIIGNNIEAGSWTNNYWLVVLRILRYYIYISAYYLPLMNTKDK